MSDFRVATNFFTNSKTLDALEVWGDIFVARIFRLWAWASEHHHTGDLKKTSRQAIARVCNAPSTDGQQFVDWLIDNGWLDQTETGLSLHDWKQWQPWVSGKDARIEAAREAGKASAAQRRVNGASTTRSTEGQREVNANPTPIPSPLPIPKKKSKSSASAVAEPPTEHREFIDFFCLGYQERFGVEYDFEGARDGKHVKELLKKYGLSRLKLIAGAFLKSEDEFLAKTGHTISMLRTQINRHAVTALGKPGKKQGTGKKEIGTVEDFGGEGVREVEY